MCVKAMIQRHLAVVGGCVIMGDICRYLHCRSVTLHQRGPRQRNLDQGTADLTEASGCGLPDIIMVVWAVIVQRMQLYLCLLH